MYVTRLIGLVTLILSSSVFADEPLTFDRALPLGVDFTFPNDKNQQPNVSDFELLHFAPLSSESGERWAVVTLTNTASGRRILDKKDLIALLADGRRIHPEHLSQSFKPGETLSLSIKFGQSYFPIVAVYSQN